MRGERERSPRLFINLVALFIGGLFLLAAPRLWGLDPAKEVYQYHREIWKTERGLPENTIFCMIQTRNAYIWLGTPKGLVRFDGSRFKIFDKRTSPHFINNIVRVLFEDTEGNLWIGTEGGVIKYANGVFTSYTPRNGLPHRIVQSIYQDNQKKLWFGTYGGGVSCLEKDKLVTYNATDGLVNEKVKCIHQDSNGRLRVGTEQGMFRFENDAFIPDPLINSSEKKFVTDIFEDKNGVLWVATTKGLHKIAVNGDQTIYSPRNGLAHNVVLDIMQDRADNIWVGTMGGLNRISGDQVATYNPSNSSLTHAYSLVEDREGSLWIGTVGGGLNRLKDVSFTTYTSRSGLSDDMVICVMEDKKSNVWIGTGSGLNLLKNGHFTAYTSQHGLSNNQIASLWEDRDGNLWIGTQKGVNRYQNGTFATYTTKDGLSGNKVSSILQDNSGKFWFGTYDGGLNRLSNGTFTSYTFPDHLLNDKVRCITEDRQGNLWIGTQGGLTRLANDTFTHYTTSEGLSHNDINCIYQDSDNTIWIGSGSGPNRLKDGLITPYNNQEAFLNSDILMILEDDYGYLWMSSNKGIFRVSKKELNDYALDKINTLDIVTFDEFDGMKNQICNGGTQPAGWKTRDGKLWFPTIKGVVTIDPGKIKRNTLPPPVLIEEVIMDDEEAGFSTTEPDGRIILSPGIKKMEFHYTGLSFIRPAKMKFKYRLEGYEKQWVDAGTRRAAYYTNLSPGNYTFRVSACNNDGTWNHDGASYSFYLKPFFYQTIWFYLLCIVAIIASGAGLYHWRIRKLEQRREELEKRKAELETLVDERTRQLKIANRKLSETNLELKKLASMDGLTGIHNYRWFREFLELEWRRGARNLKSVTLFLIDVDCFKGYNATYGHPEGDETLKKIARRLKELCRRPGDVVARYGGEEFIALFSDTPSREAATIAERFRTEIEALKIPNNKSTVSQYITISLGCATMVPGKKDEPDLLISAANEGLIRSKNEGKNRFVIREPESKWHELS